MKRLASYLLVVLLLGGAVFADNVPSRVVSMNLCTDQLAMMLAAEGQLLSVSYLAIDKRGSAMSEEAKAFEINHGRAEEIYLLQPDLVIAGAYSTRATIDMLRRLGVPVAVMQPAWSLDDVTARILEMGVILGREGAAAEIAETFERDLAALRQVPGSGPRAALYSARGWTSGNNTLAGQILLAAGLRNIAPEMGYEAGGTMPLEVLAIANPDMLITSSPYPGHSRSEEILLHPVVRSFQIDGARAGMRDSDWICGTPHVLRAVSRLIEDRQQFEKKGK